LALKIQPAAWRAVKKKLRFLPNLTSADFAKAIAKVIASIIISPCCVAFIYATSLKYSDLPGENRQPK